MAAGLGSLLLEQFPRLALIRVLHKDISANS